MPLNQPFAVPVLELTSLKKTLPGGRVLFDRLNLSIDPGQIIAVMGESGVGKSTLLNVIAGLDRADSGSIRIENTALDGLNDTQLTSLRRDRIGFVFQAFHILPHLTLAQNIALPLVLANVAKPEALRRSEAMLSSVGLEGRGGDYPAKLSGGELQRIAIGRALVHRPALILADEPTGNMDPETARRILDVLSEQVRHSGAAAMIVTHSERAAAVAGQTLTLSSEGLTMRDVA